MLPFVLIGAIMRLFGKGRLAHVGYAIAGFALVFVGISFMQEGMSGFQGLITPDQLPSDTFIGRLQLVAFGILFTLMAQSSSAGVAMALTALYGGAINFEQAAALVIGMDVGTTVTAALATVGGSVNARRTGFSHVTYNIFTGIGALLLITPYMVVVDTLFPGQCRDLTCGVSQYVQHHRGYCRIAVYTSVRKVDDAADPRQNTSLHTQT
jgi:phosphate:Na+ symporter